MWSDNVKEHLERMKRQQEEAADKRKAPLDVEFEHQKSTDSEAQLPPPPPLAPALLAPL
jgi:hypothetical protein